ncbi:MAG TPA: hypothetical protein VNY78_08925 [Edaphobacter sp.]|jgi:hypothetical protein|nr:hypothetical protein [Edaphobacter sp.]
MSGNVNFSPDFAVVVAFLICHPTEICGCRCFLAFVYVVILTLSEVEWGRIPVFRFCFAVVADLLSINQSKINHLQKITLKFLSKTRCQASN